MSTKLLYLLAAVILVMGWTACSVESDGLGTAPSSLGDETPDDESDDESDDDGSDDDDCVEVCHIPAGNPAAAHTICVGEPAVSAHVGRHGGDYLGPCDDEVPSCEDECLSAYDDCVFRDEGESPLTPEEEEACAQDLALCLADCACDERCCGLARDLCEISEPADPTLCEESYLACLRGASCLYCGDGFVDDATGEECDDGAYNSDDEPNACRLDCSEASCGDGVVDDGEECDDGAYNSDDEPNACRLDCSEASCGDGVVDDGEECDDGAYNSDDEPNACRLDCSEASCGDGVVDDGEECDDGNLEDGDGCDSSCLCETPGCDE